MDTSRTRIKAGYYFSIISTGQSAAQYATCHKFGARTSGAIVHFVESARHKFAARTSGVIVHLAKATINSSYIYWKLMI